MGLESTCNNDAMDIFYALTKVTFGNGLKASFWDDPCAHGLSPKTIAPSIYEILKIKKKFPSVWLLPTILE